MLRKVAESYGKLRKVAKIIGLTGPIGAGKDEVAKILRRRGALVIDADEVAYTSYNSQSPAWYELVKAFGSKILMRGGKVNRKKLGEMVFSDKKKLEQLNRIVHPKLVEEIKSQIPNPKSQQGAVVINAALPQLFEGLAEEVWVVVASKGKRMKRLMKTGLSKKDALSRMQAQMSQKEYLRLADVVIKNEGTLKQLNAKVRACLQI